MYVLNEWPPMSRILHCKQMYVIFKKSCAHATRGRSRISWSVAPSTPYTAAGLYWFRCFCQSLELDDCLHGSCGRWPVSKAMNILAFINTHFKHCSKTFRDLAPHHYPFYIWTIRVLVLEKDTFFLPITKKYISTRISRPPMSSDLAWSRNTSLMALTNGDPLLSSRTAS